MVKLYNEFTGQTEICPSNICCFMIVNNSSNMMDIVQCAESRDNTNMDIDYFYKIVERHVLYSHFYLIGVICIDYTCFVIPDFSNDRNINDRSVIVVHKMDSWGDHFN